MKQPDRALISTLDPFMAANGFKFVLSREAYFRKYKGGFDYFSWSSYPLATGQKWQAGYYEGHYGIGLRNNAIEAVSRIAVPIYGAGNERYAYTVYRAIGWKGNYFSFDTSRDRELFLRFDHLEEDAVELGVRMTAMLEADGFAWYMRYSDPVALSQDINDPLDLMAPHPLVNNSEKRPLVGVAAACVGEPGRVDELVDAYIAQAQKIDELSSGRRKEPFAVTLERQLGMIVEKARELGYEVNPR